ncbi:VOC family protein [Cellulomonas sp. P22]|uniref:VOC family protein n=1 Tax=Cellulomonas sp. P22 TaxID=3373189 RepID=UPI00378DAAB8
MTLTVESITFDATDALTLAAWWAAQTGGVVQDEPDPAFVLVTPGPAGGLTLGFQQVASPTPGKNRVHLDCSVADRGAEVARLRGAGAAFVAEHRVDGFEWTVLADPEGNQFCVTSPQP